MRLEINLADNSQEAQVLASIVSRDHVSPEEAVRRILRGIRPATPTERNFISEDKDMFKDPLDAQILDDPVEFAQTETAPVRREGKSKIPGLPSEPISAEDAAIVDEAMAIIMAARQERSEHLFGA